MSHAKHANPRPRRARRLLVAGVVLTLSVGGVLTGLTSADGASTDVSASTETQLASRWHSLQQQRAGSRRTPRTTPSTSATTSSGSAASSSSAAPSSAAVAAPPAAAANEDATAQDTTSAVTTTGSSTAASTGATRSTGSTPSTTATAQAAAQAAQAPAGSGPQGPSGNWNQVFGDEFTGSSVNTASWRLNRSGGTGLDGGFNTDSEGAFFSPANVSTDNGQAVLTVRPETATVNGVRYTHSSGTISSEGRFALRDGDYVEARILVPSGDGLWPAFWTVPSNRWPPEIDTFEFFDSSKQSQPMFNYHPAGGGQSGTKAYGAAGVDYRDSWHTYGLLRSNGALVPYLDGVAYPKAGVSSGADTMEQFIILNLSTYAGHNPAPGTEMRVDWVRAWRQG